MKVWEEMWAVAPEGCAADVVCWVGEHTYAPVLYGDINHGDPRSVDAEARAKLAAAAPEMARLLIRVAAMRDSEDAFDVAKAICIEMADEFEAVLRKAGVPIDDET